LTLIFSTRVLEAGTLLFAQNFFRSESAGKVSMRIAIVWPFPVTFNPSAPYALRISGTMYGGALSIAVTGAAAAAGLRPRLRGDLPFSEVRLPLCGIHIRLCLRAWRNGCRPMIACTPLATLLGKLGAFLAAVYVTPS